MHGGKREKRDRQGLYPEIRQAEHGGRQSGTHTMFIRDTRLYADSRRGTGYARRQADRGEFIDTADERLIADAAAIRWQFGVTVPLF